MAAIIQGIMTFVAQVIRRQPISLSLQQSPLLLARIIDLAILLPRVEEVKEMVTRPGYPFATLRAILMTICAHVRMKFERNLLSVGENIVYIRVEWMGICGLGFYYS